MWMSRGFADFFLGDFRAAVADFQGGIVADPTSSNTRYLSLWEHLARTRLHEDDEKELMEGEAKINLTQWPGPLVELDMKQMTAEQVFAAASNPNPKKQKDQLCEANFYTGEDALAYGDTRTARKRLQTARKICPGNFIEYGGAVAELKRMRQGRWH
jgi:lipoprotein NlpI